MALQKIRKGFTFYLLKHFSFLLLICTYTLSAQSVIKTYYKDSVSNYNIDTSKFKSVVITKHYQLPINIALSNYPELIEAKITFRVKRKITPLSARPTIWCLFQKKENRKYIITISEKSIIKFNPILLKNLSLNSQIGVLAHELSHISEYHANKKSFFIKLVFKQFNKKQMDSFEFNTDKRCIAHGFGYQLLSWSKEVRQKLNIEVWGGSGNTKPQRERYMNPISIESEIKNNAIYQLK